MYIKDLNRYFDHTLLKPEATEADIRALCRQASEYGFFSVCVNPSYVSLASRLLRESCVKVAAVVGFPLGACVTEAKVFESDKAVEDGAAEIDMVMNIGALKDKRDREVREDIEAVTGCCRGRACVKVILETCLLTEDEIVRACELAKDAGAGFVKTSTGFSKRGAVPSDIRLMRSVVGDDVKIKASGGIRTIADAIQMIDAGADRLGTSATVDIMKEYIKQHEKHDFV